MKKHIKYPKIEQFRNVISNLNRSVDFSGLDNDGNAIYENKPKPTVMFSGSVKLHGTNASVCYNGVDGFWAQSRNGIITPEKDNAGFAFFAYSKEDEFWSIFSDIAVRDSIDLLENTITIYGEWAGKGVQKSVGVSELDKSLYIFGVKVSPFNEDIDNYWVDLPGSNEDPKIFSIADFPTYEIAINFNNPQLSSNILGDITDKIEKECPVARHFGIENGIGEGVVWSATYEGSRYTFKVKGEKHSVSKVKTLAPVDIEKLESIQEFTEYAMTQVRYDQCISEIFKGEDIDIKKMGDVMKWIISDITTEEIDVLSGNGLEPKDVNRSIALKAKGMFFKQLNN